MLVEFCMRCDSGRNFLYFFIRSLYVVYLFFVSWNKFEELIKGIL